MSWVGDKAKAATMTTAPVVRRGVILFVLLAMVTIPKLGACQPLKAQRPVLVPERWTANIHAGWVGKIAAGSGALPTEMWPKDRIREKFGVLTGPPQKPTSRGPLDDTTLALLGWHTAHDHGADFTTAQIAQEWVDHLKDSDLQGGGFGREFLDALVRLRRGEPPPIRAESPRAEWIAAQMRAEIWGMLAPGDPACAAEYAARDAAVFNAGNGVYAAQFVAAIASQLMTDPDIPAAIAIARRQIPADAILARLIDDVTGWHQEEPTDWEKTWQRFVDTYRDRSLEKRFAAWGLDWLVETGGWPEAEVLAEYRGRKNVLRSHPFSENEPACLTTELAVPPGGASLKFAVTCNDFPAHVDWLLRVRIGDEVQEQPVRWIDGRLQWQEVSFDLTGWAGQRVMIVLENAVFGKFAWEAGFWTAPELRDAQGKPLHGHPPAGRPYRYPLDFAPRILPETFSVLVGLLYGEGDFRKSVSVSTMCGFDTDCNAGTVGCLLGLRNGLERIPAEWKDALDDTYEVQVTGLPRQWKIRELAREMARTGAALSRGERPPAKKAASTVVPISEPPVSRTGKFTLMALGDNKLSDFEPLVQRYDLLIASHSVGTDVIQAFRQRNPGALAFCYFNTSDVNSGWIKDPYYARLWNDTNPHEDWFHHDAQGQRVRIYYPKYKERYAFNTGNVDLQQYLANCIVETLQTGRYDGVQLDNVSTEFPFFEKLVDRWISAVPVELTPEQWTADEVAMLEVTMRVTADAGFEEKTIIFNHMRSGEPNESRAYLEVSDGANCESWMSRGTELDGRWGWKAKVDQVREANQLDKLTNVLCVPQTVSEQEALFCFASYLMALEGDRAHFFYGPAYKMTAPRTWYPFYDLNLGNPSAAYASRDGGFWRPFTRGGVAVNPTARPVTISLPMRYQTLSGEEVESLSLDPKQAAIVTLP